MRFTIDRQGATGFVRPAGRARFAAATPALALVVLAGCAGARSSRPVADFPKPEALAAIEAKPVPPPRLDEGAMPDDGWTVELPAPAADDPGVPTWSADAPWRPRSDWDRAFAQALTDAGRAPRLTEPMACAAREVGRWALDHDKVPPEGLRRFVLGACGVLVPSISMGRIGGPVPDGADDAAILQHWGAQLRTDLLGDLPADATDAGFAFVHAGTTATAVIVGAKVTARLEPFSLTPSEDGTLSLTGDVGEPADSIGGYVNLGPYGVVACETDPSVARPRFRLTCPMRSDDDAAWIELVYQQPRRVLESTFARVLARRSATQAMRYQPLGHAGGAAATSAEAFAQAAVTALNAVRAKAGIDPVRLSAAQSATATRLAPHYFSAELGGTGEWLDTIALGLLAGWNVGGMIRDGNFISTVVPQTHDPALWLASTLELPSGRLALLSPDTEEVALGPWLLDEPEAAGALVTGFSFYHGNHHTADVIRLETRVVHARKQRRLAPPTHLDVDDVMQDELDKVYSGRSEPDLALQRVMQAASERLGSGVAGYVVEATSLDAVQVPEEVLAQPNLRFSVGITHHKPDGAAWAQLVILVVYEDDGPDVRA